MKTFRITLIVLIWAITLLAQDYPLAPEVWSQPVKIDSLSLVDLGEKNPSLTENLDTMYLFIADGIYMSVFENSNWRKPIRLNNNVNSGGAIR